MIYKLSFSRVLSTSCGILLRRQTPRKSYRCLTSPWKIKCGSFVNITLNIEVYTSISLSYQDKNNARRLRQLITWRTSHVQYHGVKVTFKPDDWWLASALPHKLAPRHRLTAAGTLHGPANHSFAPNVVWVKLYKGQTTWCNEEWNQSKPCKKASLRGRP